ncbi:MAG: hypothetical protein LAP87_08285 [Acidobacteriia bacterium]|nr:hypothetical protein [Terriglobia bacterium]
MLKRFVLWDYARASWQYDVMVGIILAFIFLVPREWFRDRPRIPQASIITMLPAEKGSLPFVVDPEFLAGMPENQRLAKLTQEVRTRMSNSHLTVTRVEPFMDSEGELRFYIAFARP